MKVTLTNKALEFFEALDIDNQQAIRKVLRAARDNIEKDIDGAPFGPCIEFANERLLIEYVLRASGLLVTKISFLAERTAAVREALKKAVTGASHQIELVATPRWSEGFVAHLRDGQPIYVSASVSAVANEKEHDFRREFDRVLRAASFRMPVFKLKGREVEWFLRVLPRDVSTSFMRKKSLPKYRPTYWGLFEPRPRR